MDLTKADRILKVLSPNDLGETGSHQAGIAVPKPATLFFPHLDPSLRNPDKWLTVSGPAGQSWLWRYIYYNSRLHGTGTRNEFRMTHTIRALRDLGAGVGDTIEFSRDADERLAVRIIRQGDPQANDVDVIEISGPGRWFAAQLPVR
jgi:hypothetical protein